MSLAYRTRSVHGDRDDVTRFDHGRRAQDEEGPSRRQPETVDEGRRSGPVTRCITCDGMARSAGCPAAPSHGLPVSTTPWCARTGSSDQTRPRGASALSVQDRRTPSTATASAGASAQGRRFPSLSNRRVRPSTPRHAERLRCPCPAQLNATADRAPPLAALQRACASCGIAMMMCTSRVRASPAGPPSHWRFPRDRHTA